MEKSVLADRDSLPEDVKIRISAIIDEVVLRDDRRGEDFLAERCFTDCVDSFGCKTLSKQE